MIAVNGKIYDGVAVKPGLDEALEHYGVKGMKWRKHLKGLFGGKKKKSNSHNSIDDARKERIGSKRGNLISLPNGKSARLQNNGLIKNALDHKTFTSKFKGLTKTSLAPNSDIRNKSTQRKKTRDSINKEKKKKLGL